jgi:hypothetical protein
LTPLAIFGEVAAIASILGVILGFANSLRNLSFKSGHLNARVEELEKWRSSIRGDMHEVSEELKALTMEVQKLATIIEERTDRRIVQRNGT